MKTFNKQLLEKFFNGSCSPEQAEEVMDWLDTSEGQQYLDERLQNELEEWEEDSEKAEQKSVTPQPFDNDKLNSALLFQKIIHRLGWISLIPNRRFFNIYLIQIAASLLVIATATLFFFYVESNNNHTEAVIAEPVIYSTSSDQQKRITLRDGSVVRLNENSTLRLDHSYNAEERKVTLTGEAFFDVSHHPEKPFIVHSGQSVIEVLGTSFNVKLNFDQTEVGVAVAEGKVTLRLKEANPEQGALLEKGHFASLNTKTREFSKDDYGIDNYLVWKNGRLVFDGMQMQMVCQQLGRLYDISCLFSDSAIKDRKLTANFSNESMEKVLSVMGLSLNLTYELIGREILWKSGNPNK